MAVVLARLRRHFVNCGFLYDPHTGVWTALRGTEECGITIRRTDPLTLRVAVESITSAAPRTGER